MNDKEERLLTIGFLIIIAGALIADVGLWVLFGWATLWIAVGLQIVAMGVIISLAASIEDKAGPRS